MHQSFYKWLYTIAGVYSLSPILLVAAIHFGDAWHVDLWVILGLHGLWLLSFAMLFALAAWAAIFRDLPRMEAWWWMSVPYAAGILIAVLAMGGNELGPFLVDLLYVYFASLVSAFLWMIGAFRQIAVQGASVVTTWRMVMLAAALAVMLGPLIVGLLGGV